MLGTEERAQMEAGFVDGVGGKDQARGDRGGVHDEPEVRVAERGGTTASAQEDVETGDHRSPCPHRPGGASRNQ